MPLTRAAVTYDMPGSPYRLELVNTVVPFWFVGIYGVVTSAPRAIFEFQDPSGLIVGIHADDLQGSPAAIGPWSTYTTRIPTLPSVGPGGADEIPPGCGVRIGNVDIVAPANRPTRITSWSFYLRGSNTAVSVQGPTRIAEISMVEGQLSITGSEAYDARISANTINLHRDAALSLTNVSIGQFEETGLFQRYLELQGVASCTIHRALVNGLRVRSGPEEFWGPHQGIEATTFQITDFVEHSDPLDAVATGQSTFSVQRATPTQSFDLGNADMDSPPAGTAPSHWASSNLSAASSTDTRPATSTGACNELLSLGANATMSKSLPVAPGCSLEVRAWIKPLQVPGNSSLQLRVVGSHSGTTAANVPLTTPSTNNGWRQIILPAHHVDALDGPIDVEFAFAGNGLRVRIDDVQIRPTSWWDRESLANLDFDASDTVGFLFPPTEYRHPAFWWVWNGNAALESTLVRPGAAAGSRGLRLAVENAEGQIYKVIPDVAAGTTIHVTGWMRVVAAQREALKVHVGDDVRWWDPNFGTNQMFYVHDARIWTQFVVDYTVPSTTSKTRIAVTGAAPGVDILVDDVEVTFQ